MHPSKRRRQSTHCPFKPGDRIQPVSMFQHHDYQQGETYTVTEIDPRDTTLRASDSTGNVRSWIRWADCRIADGIGWDWLKGQLNANSLELLSMFKGLEQLRLRQDVAISLVRHQPLLKERLLECAEKLDSDPAPGK